MYLLIIMNYSIGSFLTQAYTTFLSFIINLQLLFKIEPQHVYKLLYLFQTIYVGLIQIHSSKTTAEVIGPHTLHL